MIRQVAGLEGLADSNAFLRALWAEIRDRCTKSAWNYQPNRNGDGHLIFLGFLDVGAERTVSVSLKYRTRSILTHLYIAEEHDSPLDPSSELAILLSDCIEAAHKRRHRLTDWRLVTRIEGLRRTIAPYRGDWFSIEPIGRNLMSLMIRVRAFDRVDAEAEYLRRLPRALDLLAVETNHLFWSRTKTDVEGERLSPSPVSDATSEPEATLPNAPAENTFCTDIDWIDDPPIVDQYALISEQGYLTIDRLLNADDLDEELGLFARAIHHYHVGRAQDALVYDQLIPMGSRSGEGGTMVLELATDARFSAAGMFSRRAEELAAVLYISALEVASSIGADPPASCASCSQLQYKISARVADYVQNSFPGGGGYMASVFKRHYASRSKYLHAGAVLVDQAYAGTTIPTLDPSSDSGVSQRYKFPLLNVREWTGYMLRKETQRRSARISAVVSNRGDGWQSKPAT